jgi:hypothetical protein
MDNATVAAILATVFTYWVEILDPGTGEWSHIHHPDWETSQSYGDIMAYAITVRQYEPAREIRIVGRAEGHPDYHIPVT